MRRLLFITILALAATWGCSADEGDATCDFVTVDDTEYCVYGSAITETGYDCPPDMSNMYRDEGRDIAVCSGEGERPPFEEIEEEFEGSRAGQNDGNFDSNGNAGANNAGGQLNGRADACFDGGCSQTCPSGTQCFFSCEAGGCDQTCEDGASCEFVCQGGGCDQRCADGSECFSDCEGGECGQDCESDASCEFTCGGGDCGAVGCTDNDGDGFGIGAHRETCSACVTMGHCEEDCSDEDAGVSPGVKETCDGKDNDCDGEVDEPLRCNPEDPLACPEEPGTTIPSCENGVCVYKPPNQLGDCADVTVACVDGQREVPAECH